MSDAMDFEPYDYSVIPVVVSPTSGNPTSFHYTEQGLLGERVTEKTATHFLIHQIRIEKKQDG